MRKSGVLIAVSSLPGQHGIGDFGSSAYTFIDKLTKIGLKIWQILPLNPLGYGNSPYQPYGSKPFDEIYISLDSLYEDGLLDKPAPAYFKKSRTVKYEQVRAFKAKYLKEAYTNYLNKNKSNHKKWQKNNDWVFNYAVFLTFKKINNMVQWHHWPKQYREWIINKELNLKPFLKQIEFEIWLQYIAYKQWDKLRKYANNHNITIVGDIPIYVGIDSIDVWANPEAFLLDEDSYPTHVGGVPADYFSDLGQLWGNPLYDWDYLSATNFRFWIDRIGYCMKLYDVIRIDHFRAFDSYWKIPGQSKTALTGEWAFPPSYELFDEIYRNFPDVKIIAEDLGDLRPEVLKLRDHYNLPGMEVTQFTYNPFTSDVVQTKNRCVYTGTHDNPSIREWFSQKDKEFKIAARADLKNRGLSIFKSFYDNFLAFNFASNAKYCIIPMQDLIGLDEKSRMNVPSTIGSPNWEWKLTNFDKFDKRAKFISELIIHYNR